MNHDLNAAWREKSNDFKKLKKYSPNLSVRTPTPPPHTPHEKKRKIQSASQMIELVMTINSVQKSSKSELLLATSKIITKTSKNAVFMYFCLRQNFYMNKDTQKIA